MGRKAEQAASFIVDRIRAGEWPSNTYLPSERELTELTGVCRTTVRSTLKKLHERGIVRIRPRRGALVTGDGLREGIQKTGTFCMLMPVASGGENAASRIMHSIEAAAEERGFSLVVRSRDVEDETLEQLKDWTENAKGVFLFPRREDRLIEPFLHRLLSLPIPAVMLDRYHRRIALDSVGTNNRLGGRLAGQAVAQAGHRHVGVISMQDRSSTEDRVAGFQEGFGDTGGSPENVTSVPWAFDAGRAANELLARDPSITAIFSVNDPIAIRLLDWFAIHGVRVPQQISVVGYDGENDLVPRLSTVNQPMEAIGRRAVELMFRRLERTDETIPTQIQLAPTFVPGGTLGPPREAGDLPSPLGPPERES